MARLVLVGAGHAHMTLMAHIEDICAAGHSVTVIGPGERHYYSGMGPGMLGGDYSPKDISFPVKRMCEERGATFVQDYCVGADPISKTVKLASGVEVSYDVVSFNTGSYIVDSVVLEDSEDVYTVKPIENLLAGRQRIMELAKRGPVRVGVVGGGPAGVEVAGNAVACGEMADSSVSVRLYYGKEFMRNVPGKVRNLSERAMDKTHVEMVGGSYVKEVRTSTVGLEDGREFREDVIFIAMGVKPRPLFANSGFPIGDDGGLLVNAFLQSVQYPDVFGGGDCISFEPRKLDKVGVYAVRENPVLLNNVMARLEGEDGRMQSFDPGGDYLLIYNTGSKRGVLQKNGMLFSGWLAFRIKDYIDKKFIHEFKPSYER